VSCSGQWRGPYVHAPHWTAPAKDQYSWSVKDQGPLPKQPEWQKSATWLQDESERFQSPFPSPGFLPLGEPDPALSLIALTQTIPDVPDQAPASYHVSVTSYAVIWNQYFYYFWSSRYGSSSKVPAWKKLCYQKLHGINLATEEWITCRPTEYTVFPT
jgi:hypothetical protein